MTSNIGAAQREIDLSCVVDIVDRLAAVPSRGDPYRMLGAASKQKLRTVLASAMKAAGEDVGPLLEAEIGAKERKAAAYRELAAELTDRFAVGILKGPELGRLYPHGWVRDHEDLDVVAHDVPTAWTVIQHLERRGWSPLSLVLQMVDGDVQIVACLEARSPEPHSVGRYNVDLFTFDFFGTAWQLERHKRLASSTTGGTGRQLIALLEERLERPYVGRDLLDSLLVLRQLSDTEVADVRRDIGRCGLEPEFAEMVGRIRDLHLGDVMDRGISGPSRWGVASSECRRVGRALRRASTSKGGRAGAAVALGATRRLPAVALRSRIGWWAHEQVPAEAALEAGLPVFGVLRDPTCCSPDVRFGRRGRHTVVTTPIGSYALVYTRALRPQWISELTSTCANPGTHNES